MNGLRFADGCKKRVWIAVVFFEYVVLALTMADKRDLCRRHGVGGCWLLCSRTYEIGDVAVKSM